MFCSVFVSQNLMLNVQEGSVIDESNALVTPTGDQPANRCALSEIFHYSAVKSSKNVKSTTPASFIVAHSTRSHYDHLRFQCDSSTLSTHSYGALYALSAPESPSLSHYACATFTQCILRPHQSFFFSFDSCICTITTIDGTHTCLRSQWRSKCVF